MPNPSGYLHHVFTTIDQEHPLRSFAVPIKDRPHRQTVGLRPTRQWLMPGPDTPAQVAAKAQLLQQRRAELVGVIPGQAPAALLAARAVAGAAGIPVPKITAKVSADIAAAALADVALHVSEDICVMAKHEGLWSLVAVGVCFPSHWSPRGKLGRTLDAIHEPVPDYQRIASATHAAFDRIAGSAPPIPPANEPPTDVWERYNWTLVADDGLCHIEPETLPRLVGSAEDLWLRVERQTLTALADDVVVFLIRTFLTPLDDLNRQERRALGTAVGGVSNELAEYRGWVGYREMVQRWAGPQ